jgi:mRNA-degrading endonuclease RelE of RelBE toxin-antitoxin system
MTYKQVRITEEYLEKLRKLSEDQKRSMTKVLEILIDSAN